MDLMIVKGVQVVQGQPLLEPYQSKRDKRKSATVWALIVMAGIAIILAIVGGLGYFTTSSGSDTQPVDPTNPKDCPLPDNGWTPAAYVNLSAFTQTCVFVDDSIWSMSGAITIPNGPGPFPAFVILGGSGPTDMDGSFGPNKILKDLAWGLASQGIAVLRFNKRTYQYGINAFPNNSFEEFTIADEYTNDALAALSLLATYPRIDSNRILLAGHSLGAEVTPGVALKDLPLVKGAILLAATSASLPDLIPWQYYYLFNYTYAIGELAVECRNLINNESLTPTFFVNCGNINPILAGFDAYGNYYLSEREYDPPPVLANELTIPMFVLQGTADFNVPYAIPSSIDLYNISVPTFAGWEAMFNTSQRVKLQVFDGLSHMFMFATYNGFATPQEELIPSNVRVDVINNISSWIAENFP